MYRIIKYLARKVLRKELQTIQYHKNRYKHQLLEHKLRIRELEQKLRERR